MKKLKLSIGVQDFPKMINEGYKYVDKTDLIYKMANEGSAYFLSRPRRFGKSLLCSTLGAYFEGKKELFSGLKIESLEEDWKVYPVIRIDLNAEQYRSIADLHQILEKNLRYFEDVYGKKEGFDSYSSRFHALIRAASEQSKSKVVVIIDEYDKPLNSTLHLPEAHESIKSLCKSFFEVLKSTDEYLRFTFITGVSKFSQVSLFSSLNHLNDISLDVRYATICGLTENELYENYAEEFASFAAVQNQEIFELKDDFRKWYNGYLFHPKAIGVYNPFSTVNALDCLEFREYWFNTATPTFLLESIEKYEFPIPNLEKIEAEASQMMKLDIDGNNIVALLYQTGYLTIESYDFDLRIYSLKIPNLEVRNGLYKGLLDYFGSFQKAEGGSYLIQMIKGLNSGDIEKCMMGLQSFLSGIPKNLKISREAYYHSLFYTIFSLVGTRIQVEVLVGGGRADAIVQTAAGIFVFEFKFEKSTQIALEQIHAKGYHKPFMGLEKPITLVGLNFRNDSYLEWQIEPV
jgi:hypothetical protein